MARKQSDFQTKKNTSIIMNKNVLKVTRILALFVLCQMMWQQSNATLGSYSVSRLQIWTGNAHPANVTWQEMFNYTGHVLPTFTNSNNLDNDISTPQALPFTFNYDGINCNYFYISTNGFIVLDTLSSATLAAKQRPWYSVNANRGWSSGTATADTAYNGSNYSFYHLFSSSNYNTTFTSNNSYSARTIAPFYADLQTGRTGSTPHPLNTCITWYYSPGNIIAGDTMVVVEWRQMTFKVWTGTFRRLWFQVRLHKTSNTIEFYYQWMANQYTGNYPDYYVCGLNSATYAGSPTASNVFTQSTANTNTFSGTGTQPVRLNAHELQNYKLIFTRTGSDMGITTIYPPNTDTCAYPPITSGTYPLCTTGGLYIVDSVTNFSSSTLSFSMISQGKVYTRITDSLNGAQVWSVLDSGNIIAPIGGGQSIGVATSHAWDLSQPGKYYIKSWTTSSIVPCACTDINLNNDTSTLTIYVSKVTATSDVSTMCSGASTYLHANSVINNVGDSLFYGHITRMNYSAPGGTYTSISSWTSGDSDDGAYTVTLPFTFHFFGNARTIMNIGSNGFVEFSSYYFAPTSPSLPDNTVLGTGNDAIGLVWSDMKSNYGGSIQYATIGSTPNREFVIKYNAVWDTTSSNAVTAYMILHETSNLIEFQNTTVPSGSYTQGIQDSLGENAFYLSSRNANTWSASNDAYLFASQPSYYWTANPTDASLTNPTSQSPQVSPTVTTTYTVTLNGGNTGYPDSIGVCPKTSSVTVTITPGLGAISPISGYCNICSYTNVLYTIPPVTNATSYIWDYSNLIDATLNYQHTDTLSLTLGTNSGWLTVKAYNSSCGTYTTVDSLYITVVPSYYGPGQWCGGVSNDWFNIYNWCSSIPSATIPAHIDGNLLPLHFPVINGTGAICQNMNLYGDNDSLTINGSYSLDVYGSWYNGLYGQTTFIANNSTINFTGNANTYEVINGVYPAVFHNITVNKGSDTTYILENVQNQTISMSGNLALTNGLFRISEVTSTVTTTSSPFVIPATAGLELNGGILLSGNYSITNNGLFRMTTNSINDTIGNTTGNSITTTGIHGFMDIQGGNLNIASQVIVSSGARFSYDDANSSSGASIITINKFGTNNNTSATFDVDANSSLYIGSGTLLFHQWNTGTAGDVKFGNGTGTKTIDVNYSNKFQFGDATSPNTGTKTFVVLDSVVDFNNITLNPGLSGDTLKLKSPISLNASGILALNSGILKLNGDSIIIKNSSSTAISNNATVPLGYILAEDSLNHAAVKRYVSQGNINYTFPFGNKRGYYIPFVFNDSATSSHDCWVKVATYAPRDTIAKKPYPSWPNAVTHIRDSSGTHPTDSIHIAGRYWQIDVTPVVSGNFVRGSMVFGYGYDERPIVNESSGLKAQRWLSSYSNWVAPANSTIYGWTANATQGGISTNNLATGYGKVRIYGVTNFSPWALSTVGNPLPIELLNFTANYNGKNVDLYWTTESEINNDKFTVERTIDKETFDFVAEVAGHGNSNAENNYHAIDENPVIGLAYYQLKQTDFDGHFTLSGLVPITIGKDVFEVTKVYGNNENNSMHVQVFDSNNEEVNIIVYDVLGNIIKQQKETIYKGSNDITLDLNFLPKGLYFVSVRNETKMITNKVVY